MTRSSFHHGNLRTSILVEAGKALRTHGHEGVSLRQIAKRLGVTPRALYRHFESREAVLNEMARQGAQQLRDEYLIASQLDASSEFRLLKVCEAYLEFASQHPKLYHLMFAIPVSSADNSSSNADSSFGIFESLVSEILGTRDPSELRAQSYNIWSVLHGHICLQNSERAMELVTDVDTREATLIAVRKLIELHDPNKS